MSNTQRLSQRWLIYFTLCTLILSLGVSSSTKGQSAGLHIHTGIIRVKMISDNILPVSLPSQAGIVKQAMPQRTGLVRFDALNQKHGASTYLRVFPDAGVYEDKHRRYGLHLWYDLAIDENADPTTVAQEYCAVEGVMAAEPIYRIAQNGVTAIEQSAAYSFNDPDFGKQWNFKNDGSIIGSVVNVDINLLEAWQISTGNPNVTVCVIDEGVDFTHPDLAANMWQNSGEIFGNEIDDDGNGYIDDSYGYNFVTKYGTIIPGNHGTHVAGIISAVNNNSLGVSSIAGGNGNGSGVKIMSAQTFRGAAAASGGPAYIYAADNGAVIAQSSWGYSYPNVQNQSDQEAINYFIKEAGRDKDGAPRPNTPMVGGLVVFSAGNSGDNSLWYPAASDNVIAVAAIGVGGKKPIYSNYGSWVDITAPGGDAANGRPIIYSTVLGNTYGYNQGTSFACPHVSGVAALILSKYGHSNYTPDSLRIRLEASATPLFDLESDYALYMGSGLLNAGKAMQPFIPASGITLPNVINLEIGETYTPQGYIIPNNATDQRIKWSGANPDIVSVDIRGRLMGLVQGTTEITATSYDGKYSKTCSVAVKPTTVQGIQLLPEEIGLSIGETYQLEATITPSNVTNPTIVWASSNNSIVGVNNWGLATALKEGTAEVTATTVDGNHSDKCSVTVGPPVSGISISPKNVTLAVGQKQTLTATISPSNAVRKSIIWQSSDTSYITVDDTGIITAIKAGKYGEVINIKITASTKNDPFTDVATVAVRQEMLIPEGFSPNGDGYNDYFKISLDETDIYILRIFDRSGQICYESTNYKNTWDGIANIGKQEGTKVLPGTYYYVIRSQNTGAVKKGYLIIRY